MLDDVTQPAQQGDVAAATVADQLRERISRGELLPGAPLRDGALAMELQVSRNTLREAVRLLVHEGLVVHQLYKGAAVKRLVVSDVHDIYNARRCFELRAVEESTYSTDAALAALAMPVVQAEQAAAAERWTDVGTHSLGFHRAVVHLLASARLDHFFDIIVAQLRLAFAEFPREPEFQGQWVKRDRDVCDLLQSGRRKEAWTMLRSYLDESERQVVDMVRAAAAARQG
ncbi:GntR family transcriptional regulator [Streptomyces sp. NPDC005708]|uniref:GntR family transcriptional regulator n=1 Tax=Streptomyces sp. NPDC005708 TaxID=3154564 RepID=UPI0034117D99